MSIITQLCYDCIAINPFLPTPAARSFTSSSSLSPPSPSLPLFFFFLSQSPRPRVLHPIVSSACLPTQIINRRDLCWFPESSPERKGRDATRCSSFASSPPPFFFSHISVPLDYLGIPINQVRTSGYKMNTLTFSMEERAYVYPSILLKTKARLHQIHSALNKSSLAIYYFLIRILTKRLLDILILRHIDI